MAKQVRLRTADAKPRSAALRPRARAMRAEPAVEAVAAPATSEPMRLAAEVARLEAELTAMRARIAELETHAASDPLTEVMNRRGFERELQRACAYVRRYGVPAALVYLDLDGFKPVNDRHGHAAGDAVLKAVAAALTGSVRASDTVARLGGDEFGLILWNLGEADAAGKARALESLIGATAVAWGEGVLAVGASIGFAMMGPADDLADTLARADQAMYARKAARKGAAAR